jgi:hypothetical protein
VQLPASVKSKSVEILGIAVLDEISGTRKSAALAPVGCQTTLPTRSQRTNDILNANSAPPQNVAIIQQRFQILTQPRFEKQTR